MCVGTQQTTAGFSCSGFTVIIWNTTARTTASVRHVVIPVQDSDIEMEHSFSSFSVRISDSASLQQDWGRKIFLLFMLLWCVCVQSTWWRWKNSSRCEQKQGGGDQEAQNWSNVKHQIKPPNRIFCETTHLLSVITVYKMYNIVVKITL